MIHSKTRLLTGSSPALSSRGWKCFPSVAAPGPWLCPCQLCPALPWAPCLGLCQQQSRNTGLTGSSWVYSGLPPLPVAISCYTGGFKLPRTGLCFCYSCEWCSSWPEPWVLSWPKPWVLLVTAAHWVVQAVPETMSLTGKFSFGFDLEST